MDSIKRLHILALLLSLLAFNSSCFRYSFSGTSIPADVNTIYIPFFPSQASQGLSNLPDLLNEALVERFVNQSRLRLTNSADEADIVIDGYISRYNNGPFSIAGNEEASLNRVEVIVYASFRYATEDAPLWQKNFNGFNDFDPNEDPIQGENTAASEAVTQIAQKMFDDSIGNW